VVIGRRMLWLLLLVLGGLLTLKVVIAVTEPWLVFFPRSGEDSTPAELGIRYTSIGIATSDGERLTAWQLEPDQPIADVVYFHGNGGNLAVWLPVLATLHGNGLRVLAVDYRGYGLSSGKPSEGGLYRDAEAVVRYAAAHRNSAPRRPLIFWGRSLGGPVAASATRAVTPDGLILESTFVAKAAVLRTNPVLRLLNAFSRYRFPTIDMVEDFRGPVLVIHGTGDSVIPHPLGVELYARLRHPKEFLEVPDADHNDLIALDHEPYWTTVRRFAEGLLNR